MAKRKKKVKAYATDVVMQKVLRYFISNHHKWMPYQVLIEHFTKKKMLKEQIIDAIDRLEHQGKLLKNKAKQFKFNREKSKKTQPLTGIVDMSKSGNAYIIIDANTKDVYVKAANLNRALDGDTVEVELFLKRKKSSKQEGKVVKVISRSQTEFVGVIKIAKEYAFVIPDNPSLPVDFFIPPNFINKAKNKDKVIVQMVEWEERKKSPTGKVIHILGKPGLNDVEMQSILVANGFNLTFPKAVLNETKKLPETVSEKDLKGRRDCREVTTFTIDPEDAKDFDDAISFETLDNGHFEIGVHIADVSHYVKPGSALDDEAKKRATSVYLVDRVLPMLPEKISNVICSLRPDETKLCYAAIFEMNEKGEVLKQWFGRTVIHSDRRFTYEEAQTVIETGEGDFADEIVMLNKLAELLRKQRHKNGAISFETEEVKFKFDEDGKPISVYTKERKAAHMLVEDFMLLANKSVAEFINKKEAKTKAKIPFVYRVHDVPDMERLITFNHYAESMGQQLDLNTPKSIAHSLNRLMESVKGTPMQHLLSYMAVRSMSKAVYTTDNIGHYGLAFEYYTHFTSPIRRYPDVLAHRNLTKVLDGNYKLPKGNLEKMLVHCSNQERKAVKAERAATKYKQVEFMSDKVGQTFQGMVSGVKHYGLFVELTENKCEGLIPIETLPYDQYVYKEAKQCIVGLLNDSLYKIGDLLQVKITRADMEKQTIDMALVEKVVEPKDKKK